MNISKKGLFFRELLQNWKELTLLLIDKKFWLITLKATIEAYKLLFRKFWWLIVLFIISSVLVRNSTLFILFLSGEGFASGKENHSGDAKITLNVNLSYLAKLKKLHAQNAKALFYKKNLKKMVL
jgi:hypothetical protein